MIKEPKEAEKLYRRAYRETMAYDAKGKEKPWILAANNLAVALLRRDTFDVEILKPLIDLKRKVNMVDSFNDGISVTKPKSILRQSLPINLPCTYAPITLKMPVSLPISCLTPSAFK